MLNSLIPIGIVVVVVIVILLLLPGIVLGLVVIGERQVGVVVRRFAFGGKKLPSGRLVALYGEPGYQADTLAPGWHFWKFSWMYSIQKVPVVMIQQGEIGVLVAADGDSVPPQRILGKIVACDNFQDARKFLTNGGEKGRQLGILTAGTYRINTALFTVITSKTATQNEMAPQDLLVYSIEPDMVGIVTTLDGAPISEGEIAGLYLPGHDNFQNGQAFIDAGGQRGLQEQVLLSGSWNLNPWFTRVEQVPMTFIPIGYVGVVISFIGKAHQDVSGLDFKHGDLVNVGHKGVWVTPLYPGKHPINTRVMRAEFVPTTNIVLNWAQRTEEHAYDKRLSSITVRSYDGFAFELEIAQVIHVGALEAPKVISRVGSMQNLVDHVLQPIVGNYFRNAAQAYTVLDFLIARSDRQVEAAKHMQVALRAYDVEAIDTLLGEINPPAELMHTLTERKIAQEQEKTYQVQEQAQIQRQQLVRQTELADIQQQVVRSEQGVSIAELQAQARVKQAEGEAESIKLRASGEAEGIRLTGEARALAYRAGAEAMGSQGYTAVQLMQIVGERGVRIIPDIMVNGGGANGTGGGSMVDALLGIVLAGQMRNGTLSGVANGASTTNGHAMPTNGDASDTVSGVPATLP
ncbi:MAG: SPFH domain-containing protein [Chloroflexota bacterium]|nr:SPFH domain-containing protein [Chloroflexota bacterium]